MLLFCNTIYSLKFEGRFQSDIAWSPELIYSTDFFQRIENVIELKSARKSEFNPH